MKNYLICWEENGVKKWDMLKEKDSNDFLMNLMQTSDVKKRSIFIVPCIGFVSGIWLFPETHKGNRVDFWNFFEDYDMTYQPPEIKPENRTILHEVHERRNTDTKYGFISPEGRYFHCGYQGHSALADNICFGMVETRNAELYLQEHGWCKIYKPLGHREYSVYIDEKCRLTDAQVNRLIEMELDTAQDFKEMMRRGL